MPIGDSYRRHKAYRGPVNTVLNIGLGQCQLSATHDNRQLYRCTGAACYTPGSNGGQSPSPEVVRTRTLHRIGRSDRLCLNTDNQSEMGKERAHG